MSTRGHVVAPARRMWRRGPATRFAIMAVALLVGLNVVGWVISTFLGTTGGVPSSSYATSSEGFAAYAQLLERAGYEVHRQRVDLADAPPSPRETLFVMDAQLPPEEVETVNRFVADGGTLVAGGGATASWIDSILDDAPTHSIPGPETARAVGDLGDVSEVWTAGEGKWSDGGDGEVVLAGLGDPLMTVHEVGSGMVWLLADSSPLANELIDEADNAALGLVLAGDTPGAVRFLETVHGYSTEVGFGAVPANWRWALYGAGAAALCFMWARGRRLGPPERRSRLLPPPRREYVDALATTLRKSGETAASMEPVVAAVRARVCARAGLAPDAGDDEIAQAAGPLGLADDEIRVLTAGVRNDYEVMAAGRALARLTGAGE